MLLVWRLEYDMKIEYEDFAIYIDDNILLS